MPVSDNVLVADTCMLRMKALLFVLIRSFEFGLAVDPAFIQKKHGAVARPFVANLGYSGALLVSCKHVAYFMIHVSKHLTTYLFRTDFYNHLM